MNATPQLATVVIAALLNMVINFVWYSPWLFGKQWRELSKIRDSHAKAHKGAILWTAAVSFVVAYALGWFELQMCVTTVQDGLFVGFCAWLGFVATTQMSSVIWHKKPTSLFLIETGNRLLAYLVMGGVLGA